MRVIIPDAFIQPGTPVRPLSSRITDVCTIKTESAIRATRLDQLLTSRIDDACHPTAHVVETRGHASEMSPRCEHRATVRSFIVSIEYSRSNLKRERHAEPRGRIRLKDGVARGRDGRRDDVSIAYRASMPGAHSRTRNSRMRRVSSTMPRTRHITDTPR